MTSSEGIKGGEEIEDAITKYMDRRFLSSIDLAGQGTVWLAVEKVTYHKKLEYLNGTSEDKAKLMYFKGMDRPLLLKQCHIRPIVAHIKSNKTKDWKGQEIPFHAKEGTWFGEKQLAVRVDTAAWEKGKKQEEKK